MVHGHLTIIWTYQSMIKSTWDFYALVGFLINTYVQARIQTSVSYKGASEKFDSRHVISRVSISNF